MSRNDSVEMGYVTDLGADIDQDVFVLGLDIPAGRRCYILSRTLTLTQNNYTVEIAIPADGFTGGTPGFKSQLTEGGSENVQSQVLGGVTPSGAEEVISRDIVHAGQNPGTSTINPGTRVGESELRSFVTPPIMRIIRKSGGNAYRLSLRLFAYEIETE